MLFTLFEMALPEEPVCHLMHHSLGFSPVNHGAALRYEMLVLVDASDERSSRLGFHDGPDVGRNEVHRDSKPSVGRVIGAGSVNRVGVMDRDLSGTQRHVFGLNHPGFRGGRLV